MNAIDRLQDYLAARQCALSAHELEQLPGLGGAAAQGVRHGVELLDAALQEASISPRQAAMALDIAAPPMGATRQAVLESGLHAMHFDAVVSRLDEAFGLEIEPSVHMTP